MAKKFTYFLLILFSAVIVQAEVFIAKDDLTGLDRNDFYCTVGVEFTIGLEDRILDSLGFFDKNEDGLSSSHQVGIWNSGGTLLGSVTVQAHATSFLLDGFRYETISGGPINLQANQTYTIGAETFNGGDIWPDCAAVIINQYYIEENKFYARWVGGPFAKPISGGGPGSWYEDKVFGAPNIRALTTAHTPNPDNNPPKIIGTPDAAAIDVNLSWRTGLDPANLNQVNPAITNHYFHISKDPNLNVSPINIAAGSPPNANITYIAAGLDYNTFYYWRIDESVNNSGPSDSQTIKGNVWSFKTSELPTILGDINYDFKVNLYDLSKLGQAWLTAYGQTDFNDLYDLDNDNSINEPDLDILTDNWLGDIIEVQIDVNLADIKHQISKYLNGVCINMAMDTDARWDDGTIAAHLIEMGANILRYPDTSEMYHWQECPGAPVWKDSWETDPCSPYYFADHNICDSNHTMDINDYIYWCGQIGAEPFITVNFQSGWKYDRLDDTLDEALALMQHCKDNNFNVKYWRIGSEPFDLTGAEMASVANLYAPAMRAVDPNIKIICSVANQFHWAKWQRFFENLDDSNYVDYVDLHTYWRWVDEGSPVEWMATWDNFLNDNPITFVFRNYTEHLTYIEEIERFRQTYEDYGVDVVMMEWSVGPLWGAVEQSHYQHAMIQCEIMMQYMQANLFMASRWPGSWDTGYRGDRAFIDPYTLKARPVHAAMKLFSDAFEKNFISSTSSHIKIPTISVLSTDGKTLLVYIVNKTADDKPTQINVGTEMVSTEAVSITAPGGDVTRDDYLLQNQAVSHLNQSVYVKSPAYSLTLVTISLK